MLGYLARLTIQSRANVSIAGEIVPYTRFSACRFTDPPRVCVRMPDSLTERLNALSPSCPDDFSDIEVMLLDGMLSPIEGGERRTTLPRRGPYRHPCS